MVGLVTDKAKHKYRWVNYINQRIRQNKNFLFIISGGTGTGKSFSALSIGEMLNDDFAMGRVVFRSKQLMALINAKDLPKKKGIYIVWDEAGIDLSSKNWQSQANKLINFLMQTFRHRCFVLCFTSPFADFIDKSTRKLFHAEFQTLSINFKEKTCRIKPLLIQYNARNGKFYYKFLRVVTEDHGVVPVKSWSIPIPSKDIIDAYEIKKQEFTDELNIKIEKTINDAEEVKVERTEFYKIFDGKSAPSKTGFIILECWKEGVFDTDEIAKRTRTTMGNIQEVSKTLRRAGFLQELAREYHVNKEKEAEKVETKPMPA